jgi:hypothetical protein
MERSTFCHLMRKVTRGVSPVGVVKLPAVFADKNLYCKDMGGFSVNLKEANRGTAGACSGHWPRCYCSERRGARGILE